MLAGPLVVLGILFTPYPDDVPRRLGTRSAPSSPPTCFPRVPAGGSRHLRHAATVSARGAVLAHIATVVALAGWITLPGLVLSDFYELNAAQQLGPAQAESLFNHFGDYPGLLIVAAPAKYLAGLGRRANRRPKPRVTSSYFRAIYALRIPLCECIKLDVSHTS